MRLRATRTIVVHPALPPELDSLRALSRNLYWSWNSDAADLFERIDREAWQQTSHNPVLLLQRASGQRFAELAADEGFRAHLDRVNAAFHAYLDRPALVPVPGTSEREVVAYFSLEFALTESFPNYSGGLGVLAGDHLKSASDLGLPLVGVGLFYHEGYFRQQLSPDGWQLEEYTPLDVASQPVDPVPGPDGAQLTVSLPFEGREVRAAIWKVAVGKTPLYLLDTNIASNQPGDRAITARLYGGDNETRIQQEIVLGIGGVRALHELDLHPAVCHMNEGHSALLGVERIRMMMSEHNVSFAEARHPVSSATAFTTHTAVAAGIDLFDSELVRRYLGHYYRAFGLDDVTFLGLGRTNPLDEHEPFSMALLGIRLSGYRNGVSRLHRGVSRRLWEAAWPNIPVEQVPIESVTNGVHFPTWVSGEIGDLYDRYIGPDWRDDPASCDWSKVHDVPDEELWRTHERQRDRLIARARTQHMESLMGRGESPNDGRQGQTLESGALTIAFARRFAGYKRATLLLRDPKRLAAIVNNPERPVQFIFAGKAHPKDEGAKALIREVLRYSREPEFRDRLVLLERYDVDLARSLVQGADVWLNTPLRPLEASGTSGMKSCANGGIHMSVLDGWWWEAYQPGLGWAVGRDRLDDDPEAQDAFDANSIYDLLENEVVPMFYGRDADGIPRDWVERMKASITAFGPVFNTSRMVAEYAEAAYTPAAANWGRLRTNDFAAARDLTHWLEHLVPSWPTVKILSVEDSAGPVASSGESIDVKVEVHPGSLQPSDLCVDLVFGASGPEGDLRASEIVSLGLAERRDDGVCSFRGAFTAEVGGRVGYAVRILPNHPALPHPLATGLAHWA